MKRLVGIIAMVLCLPTMAVLVNPDHDSASVAWGQSLNLLGGGIAFEGDDAYRGGSGVLIGNGFMMATKHQIQSWYTDFAFGFGGDLLADYASGDLIYADLIFPHADPNVDLVVIKLESLVPGYTPVSFYDGLISPDTELTFAGYGDYGDLSESGQTGVHGQTGHWDGLARRAFGQDVRSGAIFGEPNLRYFEGDTGGYLYGLGASGDSGGPVFVNDNGVDYLAGILTNGRGFGATSWTGYTIITPEIADWANSTMAANPFDPVSPVPEPSSVVILMLGFAASYAFRKG